MRLYTIAFKMILFKIRIIYETLHNRIQNDPNFKEDFSAQKIAFTEVCKKDRLQCRETDLTQLWNERRDQVKSKNLQEFQEKWKTFNKFNICVLLSEELVYGNEIFKIAL